MLNEEKFIKKLASIACQGDHVAVVVGEPVACSDVQGCMECLFYNPMTNNCEDESRKIWAKSEYVEPFVNWDIVPVDTPIFVRRHAEDKWERRHFAKYYNGNVFAWDNGLTSFTTTMTTSWHEAKLAYPIDLQKIQKN